MSESTALAEKHLPDFVDLNFARRLELAETISPQCFEALKRYAPEDPASLLGVAGGYAFCGGPDYPVNQIVGMGLYGEVTNQHLDEVEEFFRSRGVPSTVVLSPLADGSLKALLGERGYGIAEFNSVLIKRLDTEEPFTEPAGITIEWVTPETAPSWMRVIAKGFEQDIIVAESVFGGFGALPGALSFLARIEDEVVAGCGGRVIPEGAIAALFGTATLPGYRGRGVQSALIARRLQEGARAGCEYAVVSTHPGSGSQRNMERRGFRVAYTKVVMTRSWPELAQPQSENEHGH
jgi:GNAT superfamily N-acetyltransferase